MTPILLSMVSFASSFFGGITAFKNRHRLHHILGFTAGVILGVIAFDLLPEIFELTGTLDIDPSKPMIALVIGFLAFHIVEKLVLMHHAHEDEYGKHKHPRVGLISALALCGHSFLDGVGIGLGFQVNTGVGIAVAIAVIGHDFADGLNTVTLMLSHKNSDRRSFILLIIDSLAPILGALSTLFFTLSDSHLIMYLGFFAGFLLYIGASDILPQAHEEKSSRTTILLTITGVAAMYLISHYAGH